jgi:hypothetical protein
MRRCDGFFMGNSLSDPKDLLIPFIDTDTHNLFDRCRDSAAVLGFTTT